MRHNFDEIINRRASECKKYEAACYPEDVLPMWIADTDFAVPAEISEAIQQRAKHPCFGYPIESFEFEEAAARWERVRFGWNVDNGRQLLENRLVQDENGKYQIDFDDLEEKLKDPRTKLFFMSNPHNPAMRCFTLEELKRIGELCLKYNVLVISDEIHCDLTYQGYKHIPFGSISEEFANNCIVLINPSKTFNIAGFRTGAAIIPNKRIRDNIEITIVNNKNYGRTIFGMLTFVTAYTKCDYYADEMMQYLQQSRDMMMAYMKERIPRIKLAEPEATYLMWLDCRDLNMTQDELKAFMFNKAKLGLNDGATFGTGGTGFMRMNIACPRSTVEQALEQLEKAVNAL